MVMQFRSTYIIYLRAVVGAESARTDGRTGRDGDAANSLIRGANTRNRTRRTDITFYVHAEHKYLHMFGVCVYNVKTRSGDVHART